MSVISVRLDAGSLSRVRLSVSPAYEAVMWLRLAAAGRRHPLYGDPGAAARWSLRRPDVALIAQCQPDGAGGLTYMPDLLTPKPAPGPAARTFAGQLEAMAATPQEAADHQVTAVRFGAGKAPDAVRAALDAGKFGRRVANGLRQFWNDVLADEWTGLGAVLEADIEARSREMATHGIGHLFDTLHPQSSWTGSRLDLHKEAYDETIELTDRELVLTPTAHGSDIGAQLESTGDFILLYPAGGLGAALDRPRTPPIGQLLGRSRATLLTDLATARTTGELAARNNLAPATVSYHLGVLHRSGLVLRRRERHEVRYRRSAAGDALITPWKCSPTARGGQSCE